MADIIGMVAFNSEKFSLEETIRYCTRIARNNHVIVCTFFRGVLLVIYPTTTELEVEVYYKMISSLPNLATEAQATVAQA